MQPFTVEEPFGSHDPDVQEFTAFSGSKEETTLEEATNILQVLNFTKGCYIKESVFIKCLQGH